MRKSHDEITTAWMASEPKLGRLNADGTRQYETDGESIWYRGNLIAKKLMTAYGPRLVASNAGWATPTTRGILNSIGRAAVGGSIVGQRRGEQQWYGAVGEPWSEGGQTWRMFGYLKGQYRAWDFNVWREAFVMTERLLPRIVCADGFSMSVQASRSHYCTPKEDTGPWSSVEIGFPSHDVPLLEQYRLKEFSNICGWVPVSVLHAVVAGHGGFAGTEEAVFEIAEASFEIAEAARVRGDIPAASN